MTDRTPAEGAPSASGGGARARGDIDPAVARLLEARPAEFPPEPDLLRDPPRALIAIGSIVAIVTSFLPWAARSRGSGRPDPNGLDGIRRRLSDRHRRCRPLRRSPSTDLRSSRRTRSSERVPLILGPAALVLWANGQRAMGEEITFWRHQGYDGAISPGCSSVSPGLCCSRSVASGSGCGAMQRRGE